MGMTLALYCHGESKPSDDKDDHHIDRVKVEEKDRKERMLSSIEHVNQYMKLFVPEFEVVSEQDQYRCNN